MSTSEHTRAWRNRKKQKDLCPQCGRNLSNNGKRCDDCSDKALRDGRSRFQKRYKLGLCGYCGKNKHEEGKKTCSECLRKNKNRYSKSDKNIQLTRASEIRKERKIRIFKYYGGICSCCGESELMFLALDHIDGGGNEHRRVIGNNKNNRCGSSSTQFYKWVEKNNYPDFLQILCHNCNMGKHLNGGVCPHQTKSDKPPLLGGGIMDGKQVTWPYKPRMFKGICR